MANVSEKESDWQEELVLLEQAVREAGAVALRYFGHDPEVWWKNGGQSPVSAADLAANDCLESILRSARPDYGWLSEESSDDRGRLACARTFVVDPIDGTRGFLEGNKRWVVSVAVVAQGIPVAGVLFAPALDEFFMASADTPALKNGAPIFTGQNSGTAHEAELDISVPSSLKKSFDGPFRTRIRSASHIPSLAYRLAMVADGRLDGTLVRPSAHDWDLAAADVILARSGGLLADGNGQSLQYNRSDVTQPTLFAGNNALVGTLLRHFKADGSA